MNKRHDKGVTLVEMLIVLAVTAIVMPLIFELFMNGLETFTYSNKYISQQYAVTNTMQHIRGDIQNAGWVGNVGYINSKLGDLENSIYPKVTTLKLGYYNDENPPILSTYKYWRFYQATATDECKLEYSTDDINYSEVVTGLDVLKCKFTLSGNSLFIEIKPKNTNFGRAQAKNVRDSIITEISVQYKEIEEEP